MKNIGRRLLLGVVLAGLLPWLSGCASYEVAYKRPGAFQRVMVVVLTPDMKRASTLENDVASGLCYRAVDAVSASSVARDFAGDAVAWLAKLKIDCVVVVLPTNKSSMVGVLDVSKLQFVRGYTNGVDVSGAKRVDLYEFGMNIAATMEKDGLLDPRRFNDPAAGFAKGLGTALANRYPVTTAIIGGIVKPNAYGLGVNADQYGGAHLYRLEDGTALDPIFQGGVKRNAYGLGTHMDQFGRAVRDGAP